MFQATPTATTQNTIDVAKGVSEWIKHDGFLIVFGSIVLVFGISFAFMWMKNYWFMLQCNAKTTHRKPCDLLTHPFFGTMQLYMITKVLCLSLPEKGREAIFRDFLEIKFRVFSEAFYTWLVKITPCLDMLSGEALHNDVLRLIAEAVSAYEEQALTAGIPPIVVEKFRKFHDPHVDSVALGIYNICQCEWIVTTNTEKMGFILNSLTTAFDTTLVDAELALCDINGELDGVCYKGITVKPYKRMHRSGYSGIHSTVS